MPLPATIRVKLSTEAAGSIALTQVVVQEMTLRELADLLLGVAGKDAGRIRDYLARGSLLSGATRFRWASIVAEPGEVETLLAGFPDPEPGRAFSPARCVQVVARGRSGPITFSRAECLRRRFLRRQCVWDVLMALAEPPSFKYVEYSYKDHADHYRLELTAEHVSTLRAAAGLAAYGHLADRLRALAAGAALFYVER